MPSDRKAWSFTDELEFINQLGSHSQVRWSKKEAIEAYLGTAPKRMNWGDLNQGAVIEACGRALRKL